MAQIEIYELHEWDLEPLPGQMTFKDIDEMKEITWEGQADYSPVSRSGQTASPTGKENA